MPASRSGVPPIFDGIRRASGAGCTGINCCGVPVDCEPSTTPVCVGLADYVDDVRGCSDLQEKTLLDESFDGHGVAGHNAGVRTEMDSQANQRNHAASLGQAAREARTTVRAKGCTRGTEPPLRRNRAAARVHFCRVTSLRAAL